MSDITLAMLRDSLHQWQALLAAAGPSLPRRIIASPAMTKTVWVRRPRSKKKRVNKKWDRLYAAQYRREIPRLDYLVSPDAIFAHPLALARLPQSLRIPTGLI